MDLVVVQHTTPPLPANDVLAPVLQRGMGAKLLSAHTGPLRIFFSAAIRRASFSLSTWDERKENHRHIPLAVALQTSLLQALAHLLHVRRVRLAQDLVLPKVLLHATRH